MRRVVSMISANVIPAAACSRNSTPSCARARAIAPIGSLPGRNWAMRHAVPAGAIRPWRSAGRSPQLTREDLPLPDVPTTARKRVAASLLTMASIWFSRPKNKCSSSSLKGRKPGKGLALRARRCGSHRGCSACPHGPDGFGQRFFRQAIQPVDQAGLLQVDQVCLVLRSRLSEVGVDRRQRLAAAIARHPLQFTVDGALPCLVAGAVKQDHGVATGQKLLIDLANLGGVTLEGGQRNLKSELSAQFAQRERWPCDPSRRRSGRAAVRCFRRGPAPLPHPVPVEPVPAARFSSR